MSAALMQPLMRQMVHMLAAVLGGYGAALALGFHSPYLAGYTAVCMVGGTLGSSRQTAVLYLVSTILGLSVGVLAELAFGHTMLSAGCAIVVVILLFQLLPRLRSPVSIRWAVMALVIPILLDPSGVDMAWTRGLNVVLGCAIGVGLSLWLLPQRATDRLRQAVRAGVGDVSALSARMVQRHLDGMPPDDDLKALLERARARREELDLLARAVPYESDHPDEQRDQLGRRHAAFRVMLVHALTLEEQVRQAPGAVLLRGVAEPMGRIAAALARAGGLFAAEGASPAFLAALEDCTEANRGLVASLDAARCDHSLASAPLAEVLGEMGVVFSLRQLTRDLEALR
jgi:uncharacterized membrane protein YccC